MSWCDKLASVPSVGFGLDWHFATADSALMALSPLLDGLVSDGKPNFNVNRNDSFSFSIGLQDGFTYGVEPSKISVGFQHTLKARPVSGGPPVMEMLSAPLPYTKLLSDSCDRLEQITLMMPKIRERSINRVGIVSNTAVDLDEAPPGIIKFIKYLNNPWGDNSVEGFSIQIVSIIKKEKEFTDRCTHILNKIDEKNSLVNLSFDWHRIYKSGLAINSKNIQNLLEGAQLDGLKYFEDLAEGALFDE